jgi:hypothetical protein
MSVSQLLAYTVRYVDDRGDDRVAAFRDSASAWRFMRECGARGNAAGFPSLGAELVSAARYDG